MDLLAQPRIKPMDVFIGYARRCITYYLSAAVLVALLGELLENKPNIGPKITPAINPPACAQYATPPLSIPTLAVTSNDVIPLSACSTNQNPRKYTAGILKMGKKNPRGTKVTILA